MRLLVDDQSPFGVHVSMDVDVELGGTFSGLVYESEWADTWEERPDWKPGDGVVWGNGAYRFAPLKAIMLYRGVRFEIVDASRDGRWTVSEAEEAALWVAHRYVAWVGGTVILWLHDSWLGTSSISGSDVIDFAALAARNWLEAA